MRCHNFFSLFLTKNTIFNDKIHHIKQICQEMTYGLCLQLRKINTPSGKLRDWSFKQECICPKVALVKCIESFQVSFLT